MRILQVIAGAVQGGAETAFEDITIALHEAGIEQIIVTRGNNKERLKKFYDAGMVVHILPFGGMFDFYTTWKLRRIMREYKPDIAQAWMSRAAQKLPRVKGVINAARLGGYYKLKYYKSIDYFVANTPDIAKYLKGEGVAPENVVHINNFAKSETAKTTINKNDLNTPDDAVVALALARYHPVKGLDTLIKAAEPVENLHLWLAGEGDEEQNLRNLAKDLGVENRVHFLGWRRDRAELMSAADICVVPSRSEPFGNVMVQAWAAKIPLICSNSEGPSQYARSGEDSVVFPIDDVNALTQALRSIIDNHEFANKLIDAGYLRYLNEFSKEKTVNAYIDFYKSLSNVNIYRV